MDVPALPDVNARRLSTADIREANVVSICGLLRENGDLTRAELVRASGLTRPTVIAIVERRLADGLIAESGHARGSTASGGRPGTLLSFRSTARVIAAVRRLGTHNEIVLGDVGGNVLARSLSPRTPETLGWTAVVTAWGQNIRDLHGAHPELGPLAAVAVILPGSVDRVRRLWTLPRRPGWRDLPVGDLLASAVGARTTLVNVAAAALIGQLSWEPAHASSSALVYVGKGVGSAATVNGGLIDGATGSAGELGHCIVPGVGRRCWCGRRGCVETVTSWPSTRRASSRPASTHSSAGRRWTC